MDIACKQSVYECFSGSPGFSEAKLHTFKSKYAMEISGGVKMDLTTETSSRVAEKQQSGLNTCMLEFSHDGCEIIIVGSHGEIICLDSLSAATIWAVPGHLLPLQRAHLRKVAAMAHAPELILVEEDGLVGFSCSSLSWIIMLTSLRDIGFQSLR
jgi:hypothetical protein